MNNLQKFNKLIIINILFSSKNFVFVYILGISIYTFAAGKSASPTEGKKSGKSRRATPILSSAIP